MLLLALAAACALGIGAFIAFRMNDQLPEMLIVQLNYFAALAGVILWATRAAMSALSGLASGGMGGIVGAGLGLAITIILVIAVNMPAISCFLSSWVGRAGQFLTSDDALVVRKQYSRALGAEARGDLDDAVRLYREECIADPSDGVVHRMLAEALLKQGQHAAALNEFDMAINLTKDKRPRASTMFRMAEVLDDDLSQPEAARKMRDRILKECPGTPFAKNARIRWRD